LSSDVTLNRAIDINNGQTGGGGSQTGLKTIGKCGGEKANFIEGVCRRVKSGNRKIIAGGNRREGFKKRTLPPPSRTGSRNKRRTAQLGSPWGGWKVQERPNLKNEGLIWKG